MQKLKFSYGQRPYLVEAVVVICGKDLVITVGGGSNYHTGAVAIATSHPSLKDPERMTGTVSVFTVTGHKEDQIVRAAALRLAKRLQRTVTLAAGLHVDDAKTEDIEKLVANFDLLIQEVLDALVDQGVS